MSIYKHRAPQRSTIARATAFHTLSLAASLRKPIRATDRQTGSLLSVALLKKGANASAAAAAP
jgi:hypothetical protein